MQASSSPAKNNPPSCCLMSPSPWRQCFLPGRSTGRGSEGCVCSLPLMFPVRFGLFYLQVCLSHYFSKPADFLMELLIFFLAAAPPGEARPCTNGVHS